jgi:hypothetical protein
MNSRWKLILGIWLILSSVGMATSGGKGSSRRPITAVNNVAVTGGNITLTVSTAVPGSEPSDANDATTGLTWDTDEGSKKITVASSLISPAFTLKVVATGLTDGTSNGQLTLTNSSQDIISGIPITVSGSSTLSYTASATAAQGTGSDVHTITYTIVTE